MESVAQCKKCGKEFKYFRTGRAKQSCCHSCKKFSHTKIDCVVCGQSFSHAERKKQSKFCSEKCSKHSVRRIRSTCKKCGKVFDHIGKSKRFSCDECRRFTFKEINCKVCGKLFSCAKKQKQTKFCSEECKKKSLSSSKMRVHVVTKCTTCGKAIKRQAIRCDQNNYCSTKCQKQSPVVPHDILQCDNCGSNYHKLKRHIRNTSKSTVFWTGKNFCCRECSDEYRQKHAGKTSPVRHCLGCGEQVLRHHRGYGELQIRKKGDFGKYCSKRCYGDHKIAMNQQKAAMFLDVGTLLVWEYKRQTMTKADCYLQSTQLLNLAAPILWLPEIKQKTFDRSQVIFKRNYKKRFDAACRALKIDKRVTNDCVRCGCQFKTTKPSVDMCGRCRARVYSKQQRHHKRCKSKGLPYDPSITMEFIGERAGWKCEICGKQCLKYFKWLPVGDNLYGEVHNMSPTQDHIVPLNHPDNWTHGHTAENTQLACHQCNSVDKNMDTTPEMIESIHPRTKLGLPP